MKKSISNVSYFMFIGLISLFYSCNNDEFSDKLIPGEDVTARVVFDSSEDMINQYILLGKSSKDNLTEWVKSKGINSALNSENISDTSLLSRPDYFRAILNEDLEFQIGDTVIWYNQGNLYVLSESKENDKKILQKRKNNPDQLAIAGYSKVSPIEVKDVTPDNGNNLRAIPVYDGYTNGLRTYQFMCEVDPSVTFRYKHELHAHYYFLNGSYISELNYVASLEYLRGSWIVANYPRNLNFIFNGSVSYPSKNKSFPLNNYSVSLKNVVGNQTINLAIVNPASSTSGASWQVDISGSAAQTMINYPATQWWYDYAYR